MKAALEAAEEERDRLKEQWREQEPKFERVENREYYWSVDTMFFNVGKAAVNRHYENYDSSDNSYFDNNNYFKTEKRAQEVADKLNLLLKLERLHDTYCPDFFPNWKDEHELKYSIFYNNCSRRYCISMFDVNDYKINTFFATKEIAQKICNILNAELKENERKM